MVKFQNIPGTLSNFFRRLKQDKDLHRKNKFLSVGLFFFVLFCFFPTEENGRLQEIMFRNFLSILLLLTVIYPGILLCEHQLPKHFHLIHADFPERTPENQDPTENDCNKDCHLKTAHTNTDQRPVLKTSGCPDLKPQIKTIRQVCITWNNS